MDNNYAIRILKQVVLVNFFSFVGLAMPFPILAPLFFSQNSYFHFLSQTSISINIWFGLTVAAYPFAQFFGASLLGYLSDRFGRKHVLSISMLAITFGFSLSAYALYIHSITLFIFSRLFSGFFEGNISIARAILADISDQINKSISFGYINAAATAGFIVGPFFGGLLADNQIVSWFHPMFPFGVAAFLNLIVYWIIRFFFQEPLKKHINIYTHLTFNYQILFKHFNLIILVIAVLLMTVSFDIFYQFFPVLMVKKWHLNEFSIAIASISISISMIFSQIYLVPKCQKIAQKQLILIIAILYTILIAICVNFQYMIQTLIIFALIGISIGIIGTFIPVYLSDRVSADHQGIIMGWVSGLRSLGDAGICLFGSMTIQNSYFYPFYLGAVFMISGGLMLYCNRLSFYK